MGIGIIITLLSMGCRNNSAVSNHAPLHYTDARVGMGTSVEIELRAPDSLAASKAIGQAYKEMERLYALFDPTLEQSAINIINAQAGHGKIPVAPEVREVLIRAKYLNGVTKGVFDVTIKPLLDLWLVQGDTFAIPPRGLHKVTMSLVWSDGLIVNENVMLKHSMMAFDLSGIAKGYILDQMVKVLKKAGITKACIKAGNDTVLLGKLTETWHLILPHPRKKNTPIATLTVGRGGVATTRDDALYFERDGIRFHTILDPRSGSPATGCISVTVVAKTAMDADALATGVFILGPDEGMQLVESLKNTEAVIYYMQEDRILSMVSTGLVGKIY